jgi:hypothetical protein
MQSIVNGTREMCEIFKVMIWVVLDFLMAVWLLHRGH